MQNISRIVLLTLLLFAFDYHLLAQEKAPSWLDIGYISMEDGYYIKVFHGGWAETEQAAKDSSIIEIAKDRDLYTGGAYSWKEGMGVVEKESGRIVVRANILDEWTEHKSKKYRVYLLVQTAPRPDSSFKQNVTVTPNYPFSARVFVPGCAQIYKGTTGKGVAFIIGETLFIGGIVGTEFMRVSYTQKVAQTHNLSQKENYAQNAQIFAISRNVCIGAAAALYLWNVIDGAVAKGRNHLMINGKDARRLAFYPCFTSDYSGVALNLKF